MKYNCINGLESIDKCIGTNYKRLRLGINHPGMKELVPSFVLEKFTVEERKMVDKIINIISNSFEMIFEEDRLLLTKFATKLRKNTDGI